MRRRTSALLLATALCAVSPSARGQKPAAKNPAAAPMAPAKKSPASSVVAAPAKKTPAPGHPAGKSPAVELASRSPSKPLVPALPRVGSGGKPPAAATGSVDDMPAPEDGDPQRDRIMRMQQALHDLVHGGSLGRVRVGMRVLEAATGRLLYGRRMTTLMDPASNQKVLSTATAMLRLGPDWRYLTQLAGPAPDADGVVKGSVVLQGSGDPTLTLGDLEEMARELHERGVRRIDGGVLADPRRLGATDDSPSERPQLVASGGLLSIRVRPGGSGGAGVVSVKPFDQLFEIKNRTQTRSKGKARITANVTVSGSHIVVDVTGRVIAGRPGVVLRRRMPQQALHAAVVLRGALLDMGVDVRGAAGTGRTPATSALLALHRSAPLTILLRKINKDSNNEHAERILQTVGAEVMGGGATNEKGLAVLREVLAELGLQPGEYVSRNGSGLGHANRISPEAMSNLLRTLYLDPRIGPEMMQSLSIGGIDGTTRNRFRGTPAAKLVRAKTGTLRGKSCLSGYVGDGSDLLVFSILVEGFRQRALHAVRAAQVSAVNTMMRFVREKRGEAVEQPGVAAEGAADYESGEENLETEGESTDSPGGESEAAGESAHDRSDK